MAEAFCLYMEAFWRSPWDAAVHVALREKGVPFHTSISMIRSGVGAVDAMRAKTFTGTAPVLQHGSFWIAESLAIIEYLEEALPPPGWPRLLPAELQARARARQLMAWIRTSLDLLRTERPTEVIFYPGATPPPPLSVEAARQAARVVRIAEQLGAGPSGALFGEFAIVDVDLAFTLQRLVAAGEPVPAPLVSYTAAVWARPSVREFVEHQRPPNAPYDG